MKQYKITENNITYDIKEYPNCGKIWYLNGKRHRENGPASEYDDGSKFWYINDSLHKEDGPAIELCNGYKEYYYNNKLILNINSDQEFKRYVKILSIS